MAQHMTKILETCQISPPEGSVTPTSLPLTFLDLSWFSCFPKHLLVFDLPRPADHFTLAVVPILKLSLSAALRRFFPLAGHIVSPPEPGRPHLRFSPGGGVSFAVAESGADFGALVGRGPRDAAECHPFVPTLPPFCCCSGEEEGGGGGGARSLPLLAVQVTVFPGRGFAVGATYCHVACDGRAFAQFVRSWSLLCRLSHAGQELTLVDPPCLDRSTIGDQYGLEPVYLRGWWAAASANELDRGRGHATPKNTVRATFIMGRAHIDRLKHSVSAQNHPSTLHASTFVVTIACTWVNLIRTQKDQKEDDTCHLLFPSDRRDRSGFEPPIPAAYFGNCLAACLVSMKRSEMVDGNGILATARAIGEAIRELEKGPFRGAETMGSRIMEMAVSGSLVSVTGSTNMGMYGVDYGWGRPRKSLATHIDGSGAISLSECEDEGGGVEIGLALDRDEMNTFATLFERTLSELL